MRVLPFIVPELDINFRTIRVLTVISHLSLNKKNNPVLTVEKIAILDFLVKHPSILKEVLLSLEKSVPFELLDNEIGTVESQFPNKSDLVELEPIRIIIQILLHRNYVEIINKAEIYVQISNKGQRVVEELDSGYLMRIKLLALAAHPLVSLPVSKLRNVIKSFVYKEY